MKLISAHKLPLLIALLTLVFAIGLKGSNWFRLMNHNETMLYFARQTVLDETAQQFNQFTWVMLAYRLQQETSISPDNAIAHARLASAFTAAGNTQASQQYALQALALSGHLNACYIDSQDFTRWITTPHHLLPRIALPFEHPQAYWHAITSNGAKSSLSATATPTGCEVSIDADIDLAPFRYVMLVQELILMPDTAYRLSADTRSRGISRAWLGTFFTLPGQSIPASEDWQRTVFEFKTSHDAMRDRAHILIDAGHGTLSIRNVKLEVIP